jgi:AraC-like DNA-binding protein
VRGRGHGWPGDDGHRGGPAAPARGCASDCSVGDVLLLGRPTSAPLAALAREIFSCRYVGSPRRLYLRAKVVEALAHVTAEARELDPAAQQLSRRDRDRIKSAQQLLATRYSERWTISTLAREVGLNERKLKLGFRLAVGRTIIAYLEDQRLAAAAALLADDGSSVTDVAYSVGYRNLSFFAKRFQNRYGLPPRAWCRRSA